MDTNIDVDPTMNVLSTLAARLIYVHSLTTKENFNRTYEFKKNIYIVRFVSEKRRLLIF